MMIYNVYLGRDQEVTTLEARQRASWAEIRDKSWPGLAKAIRFATERRGRLIAVDGCPTGTSEVLPRVSRPRAATHPCGTPDSFDEIILGTAEVNDVVEGKRVLYKDTERYGPHGLLARQYVVVITV